MSRPAGERIIDPQVHGAPLEDARIYGMTMNSFLAGGGDDFTIFNEGIDTLRGPQDVDVLEAYIAAQSPLAPPAAGRITD